MYLIFFRKNLHKIPDFEKQQLFPKFRLQTHLYSSSIDFKNLKFKIATS